MLCVGFALSQFIERGICARLGNVLPSKSLKPPAYTRLLIKKDKSVIHSVQDMFWAVWSLCLYVNQITLRDSLGPGQTEQPVFRPLLLRKE